jgi:hypothetical protein
MRLASLLTRRGLIIFGGVFAVCMALGLLTPGRTAAQVPPRIIGRVEGDDFAIEADPASAPPAIAIAGQLFSGAHVTVKGGNARVSLDSGGTISVCGAARFQVLSSNGATTVVLEYGQLDLHLDAASNVVVYTPLIVATPLSIGGGERETLVGLARSGDMCLRSPHGAARIEQQLSGQSLLVPQLGEVSLAGGQIVAMNAPAGQCACSVDEAKLRTRSAPAATRTVETMGAVASSSAKRESATPQPPAPPRAPASAPPAQSAPQIAIAAPAPAPGLASSSAQSAPAPPPVLFNGPSVQQPPQAPRAPVDASVPPPAPPDNGVPIYKVLVPPLTFDASNPAPPPNPDPETFVLVRSVRVQPDVVFSEHVVGKGKQETDVASANPSGKANAQQSRGFFSSVGHFFRHIFG